MVSSFPSDLNGFTSDSHTVDTPPEICWGGVEHGVGTRQRQQSAGRMVIQHHSREEPEVQVVVTIGRNVNPPRSGITIVSRAESQVPPSGEVWDLSGVPPASGVGCGKSPNWVHPNGSGWGPVCPNCVGPKGVCPVGVGRRVRVCVRRGRCRGSEGWHVQTVHVCVWQTWCPCSSYVCCRRCGGAAEHHVEPYGGMQWKRVSHCRVCGRVWALGRVWGCVYVCGVWGCPSVCKVGVARGGCVCV